MEIIAHRGESADAPENTLAAFHLAWERGADAIELDVHLTADGRLIVCHDSDTLRTAGVKHVIRETGFDTLSQLDAGSWRGAEWSGERFPVLEDALATIPSRGRCFIELKCGPEAVPALRDTLHSAGLSPAQLAVISFHADAVAEAKRALAEVPAFLLTGFQRSISDGNWFPELDELIDQAKSLNADGLDLYYVGPIDESAVSRIRSAGLGCYLWTVDDDRVAREMARAGIDGITTNRAGWLREQLGGFDAR